MRKGMLRGRDHFPVSSFGTSTFLDSGDPFGLKYILNKISDATDINSLGQFWNDSNQTLLLPGKALGSTPGK